MTRPLKVVEICAGAGGQSLGLHKAGFEHALAVELDESAAATLKWNLERLQNASDVRVGDVADPEVWTPEDYEGVDLLAGGVPCPPFSVAGKQLGSQDERDLFAWAVELAGRVKPRALLLENVRGLSMPRFAGYRQAVADRLADLGYWSEWKLIQASDFGVPQLRPRFVLVAMAERDAEHFAWPEPGGLSPTVGEALLDFMGEGNWEHASEWARQANSTAPTIVGGSKRHGGADLGPTRAKAAWARLGVDGRGVADAPPKPGDPPHDKVMPRLTNRMVAAIQGWSAEDEWEFLGRKTSVYRQIGNAFPPPVAREVGVAIRHALERRTPARDLVTGQEIHDEVFVVMRAAAGEISESALMSRVTSVESISALRRRVDYLSHDFDILIRTDGEQRHYAIGDFKAYRGQSAHMRNEAVASRAARSRLS